MNAVQGAVVVPAEKVIVDCAARRQILRQRCPLTTGAEDIHHPIHHGSHINSPLVPAPLGWRDQWADQRPLLVRQVTRIAQMAAVIPRPVPRMPRCVVAALPVCSNIYAAAT